MTFTPTQIIIIKELCSIEFATLERILNNPDLGQIDEDLSYEEIWAMHGCTRKDFDEELIDTYHKFQILHDEPETLLKLGHFEMIIFIQVLHLLEDQWKDQYPNALLNLWNKIFIWESASDLSTHKN